MWLSAHEMLKCYNLELWTNPDAYVYYKRIGAQVDCQILLFNEEENKAYFFIKHY